MVRCPDGLGVDRNISKTKTNIVNQPERAVPDCADQIPGANPPQAIRQLNFGRVNETLVSQVWDDGLAEWRVDAFGHIEG
ncbi:hypothetical protein PSP6_280099 [Paraburkholderia tropica]|nr:hypothetical protein PSP6_280099 [Paraburkholderia tropica]